MTPGVPGDVLLAAPFESIAAVLVGALALQSAPPSASPSPVLRGGQMLSGA